MSQTPANSPLPANVWNYKLGGYQVLKKWLSHREKKVMGRDLLPEEVHTSPIRHDGWGRYWS